MSTSAKDIKDAILIEMGNHPDTFVTSHVALQLFVECIAKGIYTELEKLEDIGGTPTNPPATGHF